MLDNLVRTVKHSSIFAFGKFGSKLVGFILLPIYTKEIAVGEYGVLGVLEIVDLLGVHLLSFALQSALFRWYTFTDDKQKQKSYVFSIFCFLLIITLAIFVLLIPYRSIISQTLFDKSIYGNYIIYIFFSITFQILCKIPLTLLRIEEKSKIFVTSVTIQFTLNLLLNIFFVAFLKWGIEGILIANAISAGILLLLLTPFLYKRMHFKWDYIALKEMLGYSYPIMLAAIAATVLNLGDRFLLTKLSTLEMAGLYSLGYKFSNIIKVFIVDSFMLGLPIIGWKVVKENNNPKSFFSKTMTYFVFLLLWLGLALSAYSEGIIHQFAVDRSYWDAQRVVPLLTFGVVLLGIQRMLFFQLEISKKTKFIPFIVSVVMIFNILLNIVFIPYFDIIGAAYANIFSNLIAVIISYIVVQKYYPIKFEFHRLLIILLASLGLYLATFFFNNFLLVERVIYKGIIVFSYPIILYPLNFYNPKEIDKIKETFKFIYNYF